MAHLSVIPGGPRPGLTIRVRGQAHPTGDRFIVDLQNGPDPSPRDIPFHISVRLNQGYVARNTLRHGNWDAEIGEGSLPILKGQPFDISITVEPHRYIVYINGQYFCEYPHRLPFDQVSHIYVHGDCSVHGVTFENYGPGHHHHHPPPHHGPPHGGPQPHFTNF
ncbi:32 kDa beta-galactoside-binding lectin-like [Sitophilus oryzae]|uniref:Galectin n=1 Tax=Sitophilus oryzae TaxID=7048 RepID=A0A6J2XQ00_SITOR|nr:32 kDa beta-galactoside-binding lectin-like [Sitophilus oryzae]